MKSTLVLVSLFLVTIPLMAQVETTGNLWGYITMQDGTRLAGMTVTIESDAVIGGQMTTVSNASGVYRFPSLPVGIYTITIEMEGFQTVRRENVRINLAKNTKIDLTATMAEQTERIVIAAKTPTIDVNQSSVSFNIPKEVLDRIPTNRDVNDLMNYAPGVNNNRAYGGTQEATTSFSMDGIDVSDPASGGHWILPNQDWIEEVQISGLGANAEYGDFTGAVFNIVTKSGGNEFSGDASIYYTGSGLTSENLPDDEYGIEDLTPSEVDHDVDLSVSLGGPLLQDKAWFYISGQEVRISETPLGAEDTMDTRLHRYLGKATYQLDENNRLIGMLNYDGKYVDRRGIDRYTLSGAATKQESPNYSFNATWESTINDNMFLTLKITGFSGTDDRLPYNGDTPGRTDAESGISWQNATYTHLYSNFRITAEGVASIFADNLFSETDSHTIKAGFSYKYATIEELRTRNGGYSYYDDSYYAGSLDAYFNNPYLGVFSIDRGDEINFDGVIKGVHGFVQDTLTFGRFSANIGIRVSNYNGGFDGNEGVYENTVWAPRVGLTFDVSGDGTFAVKGHYGRYYNKLFGYMFDRERSGNVFSDLEYYDYNFNSGEFDIYAGGSSNVADICDDIDHPYVDQYVASVEYSFAEVYTIGIDYVYRETSNTIAMVNTNDDYDHLTATGNPFGGSLSFYDLLSPQQFVLQNPEGAYREYNSFMLRLNKSYSDNWTARASLVYSKLEGNTYHVDSYASEWEDLNGQTNADGKLPGYSEWEAKISASVYLPFDFQVGVYYNYRSGEFWTPEAQLRGLYYNGRPYIFLAERGSEQLDDRHLVDLRISKGFDFDTFGLNLYVDVFNLFNSGTVTARYSSWGRYYYEYWDHPGSSEWVESSSYGQASDIMDPRVVRLGAKINF